MSSNKEQKELILGRNTILQVNINFYMKTWTFFKNYFIFKVVRVESLDKPRHQILLANTHLFFHPKADFIRLLQAIVCGKHLEKLKYSLLNENKEIKEISILFGGDFNSGMNANSCCLLFYWIRYSWSNFYSVASFNFPRS